MDPDLASHLEGVLNLPLLSRAEIGELHAPIRGQPGKQNQQQVSVKRFLARNCLHDPGGWLGKSRINWQEGQAAALIHRLQYLSMDRVSSSGKSQLCL